ncbi:MAG: hydroxyacylglutathione hydrolase [Bdellovibrionales bacterium]|nr:hydroxyacylglutathione hydrolase [Bdellovibrionales bacterium]
MSLEIHPVPALKDNFAYVLVDLPTGAVGVVDPSESAPVEAMLEHLGRDRLDWILLTHHHWDHVGGVAGLRERYGARLAGAESDRERLPFLDRGLAEGEAFHLGESEARLLAVPGHTKGAMAWWFRGAHGGSGAVFTGDTLFVLGCGRLFEGTPEQMWASLKRLRGLPPSTRVYCGHEYAAQNARFSREVDPGNPGLRKRASELERALAGGGCSVPSLLRDEAATNLFLRADDPAVARAMGLEGQSAELVFAAIRLRKDGWAG